jgi:acetyltransferase-like isoleucine patch superfamily enzyme
VIDPAARIHATAELEDGVRIGPGTAVWHRAQIRSGATIGRDGVIGRDVFIDTDVILGDRVKVQNGALLYHGLTVDDGVFIGPGAILTNDRLPRALNADGELARGDDWVVSPIHISAGASIGAGAIVVAGCDVGVYAMVGAGAVVTHEVPAHAVVAGNPARRIGWACACGHRLHDSTGHPAPADRERYAMDQELLCPSCGRRYGYDADAAALHERSASPVADGAPA